MEIDMPIYIEESLYKALSCKKQVPCDEDGFVLVRNCSVCWFNGGYHEELNNVFCLLKRCYKCNTSLWCNECITDKDIEAARKEVETERPMFEAALDAFEKHVDSCYMAERKVLSNMHSRFANEFRSRKAATKKEAEAIDCFHVRVQKISNTWVISGQSMDGSQFERPATAREIRSLSKLGLINAAMAGESKEAEAERARGGALIKDIQMMSDRCNAEFKAWTRENDNLVDEFRKDFCENLNKKETMTCANCSFASKSDVRVFPAGISSSFPLLGGVLYCPERDTRVPGTLEGCELHSERKKDDEVNSLDNAIDECFREMERLIGDMEFPDIGIKFDQHGCPAPIFLPTIEQLRKTVTYQRSSPEERLKMEERLASDRRKSKRTPEGKARHLLDRMGIEGAFDLTSGNIVELAELISEIDQLRKEAVITKRIRAERGALRVCNEMLKRDNDKLRDENEILQQEVALLKSKRKKRLGVYRFS
jgi:hypothetical protein